MNTFWLKIAGLVVVVGGLIILVNVLSTPESEPKPEPKTFYDVIEEDDKRLRAEPKFEDINQAQQPVRTEPKPQPVPEFKELTEIESVEAERLFEFAVQQRKIGRLPITSFKPMVDACREIIRRFSGSEFDYKARRMLAEIPQRYKERYKVTKEEIDLTGFFK